MVGPPWRFRSTGRQVKRPGNGLGQRGRERGARSRALYCAVQGSSIASVLRRPRGWAGVGRTIVRMAQRGNASSTTGALALPPPPPLLTWSPPPSLQLAVFSEWGATGAHPPPSYLCPRSSGVQYGHSNGFSTVLSEEVPLHQCCAIPGAGQG